MMNSQELIETASKDEWTLECDRKMLAMMQNLAMKIENRATNTKAKMNAMILSLDETSVKMSNMTRISDVKNAVFCENLIADDDQANPKTSEVPPTDAAKLLSPQVAIENGLKLMENRFERHYVSLDPSRASQSETALVYRPIDKFYSPLPYLIGSDKWKEKWHLGLIEDDKVSQTGSAYCESVDSNTIQNQPEPSLAASTDSLAKSTSSIGDQMVINKPSGLFDEVYAEPEEVPVTQPSTSFFRPQPAERKIVNLFDDEPPELEDDPSFAAYNRKPINLFEDDYESVASLPIEEKPQPQQHSQLPTPPVDLFDESEFDSFIKRVEENRNRPPSETAGEEAGKEKVAVESGVQRDMKMIANEIKQVQLKRRSDVSEKASSGDVSDFGGKIEKVGGVLGGGKVVKPKVLPESVKATPPAAPMPSKIAQIEPKEKPEPEPVPAVKSKPKIANLFDDDEDESEDFLAEIMRKKAQSKPSEAITQTLPKHEPVATKIIPERRKISNLFDDEDEDDAFESIFKKNPAKVSTPKQLTPQVVKKTADTSSSVQKSFDNIPKPEVPKETSKTTEHKEIAAEHKPHIQQVQTNESDTASRGYQTQQQASASDKSASQFAVDSKKLAKKHLFDDSDEEEFWSKSKANQVERKEEAIPKVISVIEDHSEPSNAKKEEEEEPIKSERGFQTPQEASASDKSESQSAVDSKKLTKRNLFDDSNDDDEEFLGKFKGKEEEEAITRVTSTREDDSESSKNKKNKKKEDEPNKSDEITNIRAESDQIKSFDKDRCTEIKKDEEEEEKEQQKQQQHRKEVEAKVEEKAVHDKVPNSSENEWDSKIGAVASHSPSSPVKLQTIPFLDDEPPDDEDTWPTEDNNNFEEAESKPFNQSMSSYSMPLFSDVPPDDDDDEGGGDEGLPSIPSLDDFDDAEEENEARKHEDIPVIDAEISKTVEDPFRESIRKSIERNDFNDQWSDFKEKIQAKTEIDTKVAEKPTAAKESTPLRPELLPKVNSNSNLLPAKNDSFDESDRSATQSVIRTKLDLLKKSQEQSTPSQSEPKKLPGKLSSSLKINVGALMPGARLPVVKREEAKEDAIPSEESEAAANKSSDNSSLLNNEATKSRAKIQVKRRPSTRKGRRSNYEKNLSAQLSENEEKEEERRVEDEGVKSERDFFSEEPPPLEAITSPQTVVTNKIPVFYDDYDETKKMLEEQKFLQKSEKLSSALFDDEDDDIFGGSSSVKIPEKKESKPMLAKSLFDDENDEEFVKVPPKEVKPPPPKATAQTKSLFNDLDDEEDDDLFGKPKTQTKETAKLFDDENQKQGSIIFSKPKSSKQSNSKKQSLFGDSEEEDDDDLFSSKSSKIVPSKSSTSVKPSTAATKKVSSTAVNDPLKDLFDD